MNSDNVLHWALVFLGVALVGAIVLLEQSSFSEYAKYCRERGGSMVNMKCIKQLDLTK